MVLDSDLSISLFVKLAEDGTTLINDPDGPIGGTKDAEEDFVGGGLQLQ